MCILTIYSVQAVQFLLTFFLVLPKAPNSICQLHQHAISEGSFCFVSLISLMLRTAFETYPQFPLLSFICFEMHCLISLEPHKIKSVWPPQHRHFRELHNSLKKYCLRVQLAYVFPLFPRWDTSLTVIPDIACFK